MAEAGGAVGEDVENDPDVIAVNPPKPVSDPKQFFQVGAHEGKWSEYDERGVPQKNAKKKKLTKKEKDQLETEFLEAKKAHAMYLKAVTDWEQRKVNAEAALERTDRLRWAFRQVGEDKTTPIMIDELEELFRLMGWEKLTKKEATALKKGAQSITESDGKLGLDALRVYTREQMPVILLEERLNLDSIDDIVVEDYYSPRSWRRKLEDFDGGASPRSKGKRGTRAGQSTLRGKKSTAGGASPRAGGGDASPRSKKSVKAKGDGAASPRASASPRAGGGSASPRARGSASPRGKSQAKRGDKK